MTYNGQQIWEQSIGCKLLSFDIRNSTFYIPPIMSHHIYHTRGIILGSVPVGESNRFYKIFTEEMGLVGATAQSVREGRSKLRYTLQDLSFVSVDLVRGKEVWRITSAGEWHTFPEMKGNTARLKLFARVCSLVARLLQGEGREQELFADIVGVAYFLETCAVSGQLSVALETLAVLRVLVYTGYIDPKGYEEFLKPGVYSQDVLKKFERIRVKSIPQINEAIRATHL